MPTAGSMASAIRTMYGDPDRDFITDSLALDWLDRAQRRFCHRVLPLDEYQDFTITAKQNKFTVATDCITPVGLMWYQSRVQKLTYTPPDLWMQIEEDHPNTTGIPERYAFVKQQIYVGPQVPTTNSATALASGAAFASATTFNLTAASGTFRSKGFLRIGTALSAFEIVEYTTVATTQISGLTRGVHNTTAASTASNDQVTQIDMIMSYRKEPAVLSATTSTPQIPLAFHDYLEKYALYLAWLATGDQAKADRAFAEFEQYEKDAIKTVGRRVQDGMMHIQERRQRWRFW